MALAVPFVLGISGCPTNERERCQQTVDKAWKELKEAEAGTLHDGILLTRASGVLAQARVRYEIGKYEACTRKARRALELIHQAQK